VQHLKMRGLALFLNGKETLPCRPVRIIQKVCILVTLPSPKLMQALT